MIVVSDSTPVHYLILVQQIELLPRLFGRVITPPDVMSELSQPSAPEAVRDWVRRTPQWLEVRSPKVEDSSMRLGRGERQAICLARELGADLVLMDDRKARRLAESQGLAVVGTLNILKAGSDRGFLDFGDALERLRGTSFHVSEDLLRRIVGTRRDENSEKP